MTFRANVWAFAEKILSPKVPQNVPQNYNANTEESVKKHCANSSCARTEHTLHVAKVKCSPSVCKYQAQLFTMGGNEKAPTTYRLFGKFRILCAAFNLFKQFNLVECEMLKRWNRSRIVNMAERISWHFVPFCAACCESRVCFEDDMELWKGRRQREVRLLIFFGLSWIIWFTHWDLNFEARDFGGRQTRQTLIWTISRLKVDFSLETPEGFWLLTSKVTLVNSEFQFQQTRQKTSWMLRKVISRIHILFQNACQKY